MTRLRMLPMLALTLLIASCGTAGNSGKSKVTLTPPSTGTLTGTTGIKCVPCSSLRIVELSRLDTTGTKKQVIPNNAVISEICGEDPE